jgi:hypothetical protein
MTAATCAATRGGHRAQTVPVASSWIIGSRWRQQVTESMKRMFVAVPVAGA